MRSLFYLILSLLVVTMFFPEIGGKLEGALVAFLDMAETVFQSTATVT
ncbi:MAG: hypothetical protein U9Q03_02865 [Patescibacteria group bacterium]|nr:hypothetical protein [Patescibacteria group bacterium]